MMTPIRNIQHTQRARRGRCDKYWTRGGRQLKFVLGANIVGGSMVFCHHSVAQAVPSDCLLYPS